MNTITIADLVSMDSPRDGWFHIEANGDHPSKRDGQSFVQVLDNEAMRAICESGCPEEGILIDTEHRSVPGCAPERNTEAAGWVRELATFDDGEGNLQLAGRIEWSDTGLMAVQGRRYKHFSTVYRLGNEEGGQHNPDLCEPLGGGRWRPLALLGLALTNQPNNYGQRPIVNHAETPKALEGIPPKTKHTNTNMNELEEIKKALGLAPDAPLEDTLKAIDALQDAADEAAEAEAETLLNSEGLADLPKEEKEELKSGLQTNRGLTMLTIRALKERNTAEGVARYASDKAGRKANPMAGDKGSDYARTVVNHAHDIQARERAAGRTCSFWKAKAMAKQELGKRNK